VRILRANVLWYPVTLAFALAAMIVPWACITFVNEHIRISGIVLLATAVSLRLVFQLAVIVVLLGIGNRIAAPALTLHRAGQSEGESCGRS